MARVKSENVKYTDDNEIVLIEYNPNDGSWQLNITSPNKPDFTTFINAMFDITSYIISESDWVEAKQSIITPQVEEQVITQVIPQEEQVDPQDLLKNLDSDTVAKLIALLGGKQLPEVNVQESVTQPIRNIQDIPDNELLEFDSEGWLLPKYDDKGQMILCGKTYMEFDGDGIPKFPQPQPIEFKYIKTEKNHKTPKHKGFAEKVKTQNGMEIATSKQAKKIGWS